MTIVTKAVITIFILTMFSNAVLAYELSEYPDFFLEGDELNVVIVVGDKASSAHVLAQTSIALSLTKLVNKPVPGLTKLASEVNDLEENIISIGNACDNDISAKILGNPKPCDKNIEAGKGVIELFENHGYIHIVLNAYSDDGVKKLGGILADYENHDFAGKGFEADVPGEEERKKENSGKTMAENEEKVPQEENIAVIAENDEKEDETNTEERGNEVESEPEPVLMPEEGNFLEKFINWILRLFKRE